MKSSRAAFLAAVFVMSVTASQAEDGSLRTVLEGRYAAMKAAMANRDAKEVAALLAPDFVSVDVAGRKKTGAQMIDGLEKAAPTEAGRVSTTTLLSVEESGDRAAVKQRYNMKTTKAGPDGVQHQVELTSLSSDVWLSAGGTWVLQRTETDQMDYVIDGKPLVHRVRKPE